MAIAKNIAPRTKRRAKHAPWRPIPNIAKRARALVTTKRKGIAPLTKAQARAECSAAAAAHTRVRTS